MNRALYLSVSGFALIASASIFAPVHAQDTQEAESDANVITVTARKRSETDLEVPIAIKAIGQAQLDRQGIKIGRAHV